MSEISIPETETLSQASGSPVVRPCATGSASATPRVAPSGSPVDRRTFLHASGFALFASAVAGCSRAPVKQALAPIEQPEETVPGRAEYYSSVCGACSAACGVLVKTRDGRPIKLEGNPDHPLSRGGLCAVGQASVLALYDSQRLTGPLIDGQAADWSQVDGEVRAALAEVRAQGRPLRLLTGTIVSPALRTVIRQFLESCPDARHVVYDALSSSAIPQAHQQTHGVRVLPHYRFDKAEVVVSFDADFLGTWVAPVEFTAGYAAKRSPQGVPPAMSYHVQFESRLSLTGSNADARFCVLPGELGLVMTHLAARLAVKAGKPFADTELGACHENGTGSDQDDRCQSHFHAFSATGSVMTDCPVPESALARVAEQLWTHTGKSLVVCGAQVVPLQVLCNYLNELIGAYGTTLDLTRPSYQRQGDDGQLATLLQEIDEGKVGALLIAGANPVFELPGGERLAKAMQRIPLLISFADRRDETASLAKYVCPDHHFLETWSDAEPVAGIVAVNQPAIRPLGNTRALLESVVAWMGRSETAYDIVRAYWESHVYPRLNKEMSFTEFWDRALLDGFAEIPAATGQVAAFHLAAVVPVRTAALHSSDQMTVVLYPKVGMLDGRHAHIPWLQELPDPVTKVTWDNYASLAPETAAALNVEEGDVVRVVAGAEPTEEVALELPVFIQPGQHRGIVALALGYGRSDTERFARIGPQWLESRRSVGANGLVGVNCAPLLQLRDGLLRYERDGVMLVRADRRHRLACTQQQNAMAVPEHLATPGAEVRAVIEETTLAEYRDNPASGRHGHHASAEDLWPDDHPYTGHHWGMAIDLAKCTGCSACVVACQAENNIPVVGRDEVRRSREMHWLRIDRYYSDTDSGVDVSHQPMLCQHCDNAPCETVCPVLATVHSEEGLNQQVYNRCVGTRYCANNCPYKARRFNWFDYRRPDPRENLVLNPDITVRSRGVMEKCSFCVHRIQEAKLAAQREGRVLADGEIRPACQQSCPARAISFGDLNYPDSTISQRTADPRAYRLLEELNVRPSVTYLRRVRNRDAHHASGGEEQHV